MFADRVRAALDRDPSVRGFWGVLEVVLSYAGFHALLLHDLAHFLHARLHVPLLPRLISQFSRLLTGVEIHPGARIGRNVFIDHGMGVVIGETAEIGAGTTIFQGVTLGGTGKEAGKRHPTIGRNVVLGVGAAVLGKVVVGDNSYVGAGAVVLRDIPPDSTAVGVPARTVRMEGRRVLGATLDHTSLPDPVLERLQALQDELERAEELIELEAALPHLMLAVSAPDLMLGREAVERMLAARHVAYTVHDTGTRVRVSVSMRPADAKALSEELGGAEELEVVAEGREPNLRGDERAEPPNQASDAPLKVVITVAPR
jgi:serine O-acetyltransferase